MILLKEVKEDLVKVTYDSSNIKGSSYNTRTKELILVFPKGQYKYPNVNQTVYNIFEGAESQGKQFNSSIKTLPFVKLEGDVAQLGSLIETDLLLNINKKPL